MSAPALAVLVAIAAFAAPAAGPDAAPVADDALARSVSLMARIGSANAPRFSADGERLAFISNLNGVPQLWTVPAEGGYPELVTASDDPVSDLDWSPDGRWLAFEMAPGGGLNAQVYLVRPDGTGLRRLTDGGRENNFLGVFGRDGRTLTLSSNRRDPAAADSYLADVATGALRLVARNRGLGFFTDLTPDGKWALLQRLVSRGDNNLYLVEVASGREILLTPHTPPGLFSGELAADGRAVYLSSNADRDRSAFARIPLGADGAPGALAVVAAREDAELQEFALDHAGRTAALLWNVAGRNELAFVDLAGGGTRPGPALPAETAFSLEYSPDDRRLAMTVAGAAAPADLWVLDLAANRFHQVTRSPHAGVDLSALVRPELVRFPAHDGLELSGWLYRPRGATGPGPMVLSFHGGPEGQERPTFRPDYQALLAAGIGVFAPNVRGSSGFGKRFVNLDNGARRVDGVRDIESCVDYVVKAGAADPRRIGIVGGSYGGYMVMAGLTEYPDLFAAGADLFGVVNFETFFKHTEPWMAAISTVEYGNPATEAEMLRRLSPIHRLDRVKAPTLVLHGANDTNVPVVEAEQVVETLKKRGVPVEYVLFPDEGHGFRKQPNRIRSITAQVRFFARYLKDGAGR